jgi:hypothetical protein
MLSKRAAFARPTGTTGPDRSPIDYLEVQATVFSRTRIRLGLVRLKRRGLPIEWFESKGWWQRAFMVWGHPILITKLELALGHIAMRPPITHGRNINIVI